MRDPVEVSNRLRAVDQAIAIHRPLSTMSMSGSPPKTLDRSEVLETAKKIIDWAEGDDA